MQLFLIRGLVAIAWAAVVAAVADSLTTGVTVAAGILVVIYPLIDAAASLIDARSQHGSAWSSTAATRRPRRRGAGAKLVVRRWDGESLRVGASWRMYDRPTLFGRS
jgi:hypothetical protein